MDAEARARLREVCMRPEDDERERLGRIVRNVWIEWAREHPNPKPSWLHPWEDLTGPEREGNRRIAWALVSVYRPQMRVLLDALERAEAGRDAALVALAERTAEVERLRAENTCYWCALTDLHTGAEQQSLSHAGVMATCAEALRQEYPAAPFRAFPRLSYPQESTKPAR